MHQGVKAVTTSTTHFQVEIDFVLSRLLSLALRDNLSVVFWKKPGDQNIHVVMDIDSYRTLDKVEMESLGKGFLFSPFRNDNGVIFIAADIHIQLSSLDMAVNFSDKVAASIKVQIEDIFHQDSSSKEASNPSIGPPYHVATADTSQPAAPDTSRESFIKTVTKAIHDITNEEMDKVVPSRRLTKKINKFDPVKNFLNLAEAYPSAFVNMVSIPKIGTWMGATPEELIQVWGGKRFKTTSLAGTQAYEHGLNPADVGWTQKEIEEQAMVSRYIINCFKKIRLREFIERGPRTVLAGNLMHLQSTFEVDLEETGFSNLGSVMLELLHPTSAVCGMPKEASMQFLRDHEPYDRKFFSGFLGPVNINDDSHIYVNLRCMEVNGQSATLYAGAGVTQNSNPDKEWLETEMKLETLLNVVSL